MKKEDFMAKIQEIGTCEDDAQRRTLLAELGNDASADYDSFAAANQTAEQLRADNEDLRKANLKLFKMVSVDDDGGAEDSKPPEPDKEKLTFNNLFDEKGKLK